ncbi:GNAT family N-acetyltransferase [Sporolactobacillus sp. STSJ-5]|uniref:GNAT family N-acetyltransferase n=1 Tax=Sporolactobacillus sp. STSJ-5 TaxID=2965076 RepID=UPI00351D70D7
MLRFETLDVEKYKKQLLAFRQDSFVISFGTDRDFHPSEYLAWLQKKVSHFPNGFVLAFDQDQPVGQLELSIRKYEGKRIGYVHLFYLIAEKRGYGLGHELQQYAMRFFKKNGVSEYHLRVSPTNSRAKAFYKKNGMKLLKNECDGKVWRMRGTVE